MIISTSFYDMNEMMILTEKVISKISVDSNFKFIRQSYYSGSHWGSRGAEYLPDSKKFAKNRGKSGKNWEKEEKLGRKGKGLLLCPPDR